jgi:hypothetical protein
MPTQQSYSVVHALRVVLFLAMIVSVSPSHAAAQNADRPSFAGKIAKQVLFDPTTYLPAIIAYDASIRDWNTSQPFFQSGFLERNPRYTISGSPYDAPLSYSDGRRRIVFDAMTTLGSSVVHNTAERTFERMLADRYPGRRKLVRTLGWIERASFGATMSYVLSAAHYRQAGLNQEHASQLGLR